MNKLIEFNKKLDIYAKWETLKNLDTPFEKNLSGIIQRRLDYIPISQNLQEYLEKFDVLNAFSSDY